MTSLPRTAHRSPGSVFCRRLLAKLIEYPIDGCNGANDRVGFLIGDEDARWVGVVGHGRVTEFP